MICLSSFSHSFMPCLPPSFAISSLPCSPPMTSAPFGVLCPYLAAFPGPHISIQFAAWVQTSGVLKWLFTCWCSSTAPLFVISVAESSGPSRHCLSSVPALLPSQASLVIIMTTPFGVTHVFGTSPNCPSCSWGFRHLQELQIKFLLLPSNLWWHQISRSLPFSSHPCL